MATILLTEDEVAARLRCSRSKVRRLRLSGRLTYLPGKPPMVDEADLEAFIEREKRRREPPPARPVGEIDVAAIRQRARMVALRRRFKGR